jgi:hypothetical protein
MSTDLIQSLSSGASIPSLSSSSRAFASGAASVSHSKTWRKPADKPKHPLNAYNLFFQFERANMLGQESDDIDGNKLSNSNRPLPTCLNDISHLGYSRKDNKKSRGKQESRKQRARVKSIPFADLARTIASRWKKLDPDTRAIFEERAVLEKERYVREIGEWKANQEKKTDLLHPNVFNADKESVGSCPSGSPHAQHEKVATMLHCSTPNESTVALQSTSILHAAETTNRDLMNPPANASSIIPRNVSTNSTLTYYDANKHSMRLSSTSLIHNQQDGKNADSNSANDNKKNCSDGNMYSASKSNCQSVKNTSSAMISSSSGSYSSQTSTVLAGTSSSTKMGPHLIYAGLHGQNVQYSPGGGGGSPPHHGTDKHTDIDSSVSTLSTDGYTADERPSVLQDSRHLKPLGVDRKIYHETSTDTVAGAGAAAYSANYYGSSTISSIEELASHRQVMHQMLAYHALEMRRISEQLRQLESSAPADIVTLTGNSCSNAHMMKVGIWNVQHRPQEQLQLPSHFGVSSRVANGIGKCRCCSSSNFHAASTMPNNSKLSATPHWPQPLWTPSLPSPALGAPWTDHQQQQQHHCQHHEHGIDATATHSQQSRMALPVTSTASTHLPILAQPLAFVKPNPSTPHEHHNLHCLGGGVGLPFLATNNTTTPHHNHPTDNLETPYSAVITEEDIAALEKHFKWDFPCQDD